MPSPQKENGYTPIANEILEALAKVGIPPRSRRLLDVIFRKTYGFKKKRDRIAISQFAKATNLDQTSVCRGLKWLTTMQLVIKINTDEGNVYIFQKDHSKWVPLAKVPVAFKPVAKGGQKGVAQKPHTKEITTTKEINTSGVPPQAVVSVIDAFKEVNPAYRSWFKNKTQRAAAEWLVETYGLEKVLGMVSHLPTLNQTPYAPTTTTPDELKRNIAKINAFVAREKGKNKAPIFL